MKLVQEINCRIEELTPEHQIMIVRLINSLASHRNNEIAINKVMRKIQALTTWLGLIEWNKMLGGRHVKENQDVNKFLTIIGTSEEQ